MKIITIQNCEIESFGVFEKYLVDRSIPYDTYHAYRENNPPDIDQYDAVLVGGTPVAVYDIDRHPFMQAEAAFLRAAIEKNIPCLGVCAGAQLLAHVLGATVTKSPQKEIGAYEVRLTDAGIDDPLFGSFPNPFPVFHWHGDMFGIPPGGSLLATGENCPHQAFRKGRTVGLQFHLEITCREAGVWAEAYADELAAFGKDRDEFLADCREYEATRLPLAGKLLGNFLRDLS